MRAIVLEELNQKLAVKEVEKPTISENEVLVKIHAAAFNHRDLWIQKGQYAGICFPIILGSDGSGIVAKIGTNVNADWLNKEVVINPSLNWGNNP
jgi:NADPH:quinone reductase-like Zn-dependent oxidoreductase